MDLCKSELKLLGKWIRRLFLLFNVNANGDIKMGCNLFAINVPGLIMLLLKCGQNLKCVYYLKLLIPSSWLADNIYANTEHQIEKHLPNSLENFSYFFNPCIFNQSHKCELFSTKAFLLLLLLINPHASVLFLALNSCKFKGTCFVLLVFNLMGRNSI